MSESRILAYVILPPHFAGIYSSMVVRKKYPKVSITKYEVEHQEIRRNSGESLGSARIASRSISPQQQQKTLLSLVERLALSLFVISPTEIKANRTLWLSPSDIYLAAIFCCSILRFSSSCLNLASLWAASWRSISAWRRRSTSRLHKQQQTRHFGSQNYHFIQKILLK